MDIQIKELQDKAFAGDEKAHEMYQEYVNKGQAPAIRINNDMNESKPQEMYKNEEPESLNKRYGGIDPRRIHEYSNDVHSKMSAGYAQRQMGTKDLEEVDKTQDTTNTEKSEAPKVDNRSPLEKMIAGLS